MNSSVSTTAGAVAAMPQPETSSDDSLDLIWGCDAIAQVIGRSSKSVYYMLSKGELPCRQVGKRWVASRKALRDHFSQVTP